MLSVLGSKPIDYDGNEYDNSKLSEKERDIKVDNPVIIKYSRNPDKRPTTVKMVQTAFENSSSRKGVSLQYIRKFVTEHYGDSKLTAILIKKYLKKSVEDGTIVKTNGNGFIGLYKLVVKKNNSKKIGKMVSEKQMKDHEEAKSSANKKMKNKSIKEPTKIKIPTKKKTLEKDKKAPATEKKTPVKDKKAPAKKKKTPVKDKKVPAKKKKTPVKDKKAPAKEKKTPVKDKKAPPKEKKTPVKDKKVPAKEKKTPLKEKISTKVEKSKLKTVIKKPAE